MKKRINILLASAVLLSACAEEIGIPTAEGEYQTVTIQAQIPKLKAGIDDEGKSSWQAGDIIGIHTQNGDIAELAYQDNNTFVGQIETGDELSDIAIYPFNIATSYNEEKGLFNVDMPTEYSYVEGNTFAPHLGTKNDEGVYMFKPYSALFKFVVTNVPSEARGFRFLCGAGKKIVGAGLAVQYYNGNKYIETVTTNVTLADKVIDIHFTPEQIRESMTFSIPVPVSSGGYYFNVALCDANGDVIPSTARVVNAASAIVSMPYGTVRTYDINAMPKTYTSPVKWNIGAEGGKGSTSWRNNRDSFVALWPRTGANLGSNKYTNRDTDFHIWPIAAGESARMQFITSPKHTAITNVAYEFQTNSTYNYNAPVVKSFFTDDYFEFCIPVENFAANTDVTFSAPIYSRGAPIFWNIEYYDGGEWKCNKSEQESLDVIGGSTEKATAVCTWVLPHGAQTANFEGVFMTHTMTFANAIEKGHLRIRMKAVGDENGIYITNQSSTYSNKAYLKSAPVDSNGNSLVTFCNLSDTYKAVTISW